MCWITCLAIACIAFVLPAGLKTVAWTDFIFGIVIVIGGVFVTMKSLDMAGGFSNVVEVLPPEIMSFPKGLFAVGGFTLLSWFLSPSFPAVSPTRCISSASSPSATKSALCPRC